MSQDAPQIPGLTNDDNMWSILAHVGGILISFVAPLVVLLVRGPQSPAVKAEATEALNFQITVAIAFAIASVLSIVLIGFLLIPVIAVLDVIFSIMAAMQVSNSGGGYRYPMTLRLIK